MLEYTVNPKSKVATFLAIDATRATFVSDSTALDNALARQSQALPQLHNYIRLAKCWSAPNGPKGVFYEVCCYRLDPNRASATLSHVIGLFACIKECVVAGVAQFDTSLVLLALSETQRTQLLTGLDLLLAVLEALSSKPPEQQSECLRVLFSF